MGIRTGVMEKSGKFYSQGQREIIFKGGKIMSENQIKDRIIEEFKKTEKQAKSAMLILIMLT